ncbi:MAG: hypothetical protein HKM94_04345 [Halobacteria archaeon]|nr:hypothetical protein [Halobacteria archaeon]
MTHEHQIRRYAAYFKGWCQAFGEHEGLFTKDESISWLYTDDQIGLILPEGLNKKLYREVLGKERKSPVLTLRPDCVYVGKFHYDFSSPSDVEGLNKLTKLLNTTDEIHLYLTYHFMYQRGTRIITFSHKPPWGLIYKEIDPMQLQLD